LIGKLHDLIHEEEVGHLEYMYWFVVCTQTFCILTAKNSHWSIWSELFL